AIQVLLEPEAVVNHPTRKGLLVAFYSAIGIVFIVEAIHSLDDAVGIAIFTSQVAREGKCHLVEELIGVVVVFDLDAVVGVYARAAGVTIPVAQRIFAHSVVVEDHRNPRLRPPQNLSTQPGLAAKPAIRLPSVDDPRFNLQFLGGEPLYAYAIEEPWRVRRHVRWLVGPVIEVVVTEQADIGDENSSINIQAIVHIPV